MFLLAQDVMDGAAALLNDVGKSLFTYTVQTPYLRMANEKLELLLIANGISTSRVKSTAISVTSGTLNLTLPTDFLLPINLWERAVGDTNWTPMTKKDWEPDTVVQTTSLIYWSFRNNAIYFVGATTNREVLLQYDKALSVVTGPSSPEDFYLSKTYLQAKSAELLARYVGMNKTVADDILSREVMPAEDNMLHAYVLEQQGVKLRRPRYSAQRQQYTQ